MRLLLRSVLLCVVLLSAVHGAPPRKGISYKPTPEGGRACYVDGVFAYEMPQVPMGLWGSTYGVKSTPAFADGPSGEKDWAEYLRGKGVVFAKGASATYYADFGHLVVVNTREQHAVLTRLAGVESRE